jgi:hypothetical protein
MLRIVFEASVNATCTASSQLFSDWAKSSMTLTTDIYSPPVSAFLLLASLLLKMAMLTEYAEKGLFCQKAVDLGFARCVFAVIASMEWTSDCARPWPFPC